MSILFKLTYGLFVLSSEENGKHNGCVVNTVMQQTAVPETISVTVNKDNLTCDMIKASGKCAVSILDTTTTFDTIKNFGMASGRNADKFAGVETVDTASGLKALANNSLGYLELKVESTVDLGTHYMFVCTITDNKVFDGNKAEPLTYAYYHAHVKPQPAKVAPQAGEKKERWICNICGYIHEGPLPADFICPLCKHGVSDFSKMED